MQRTFDLFFSPQPWLALPWFKRKEKGTLAFRFHVPNTATGIPRLAVVDAKNGQVLKQDATRDLSPLNDPLASRRLTVWPAARTRIASRPPNCCRGGTARRLSPTVEPSANDDGGLRKLAGCEPWWCAVLRCFPPTCDVADDGSC